ncbi:MAG: hypothetical protein U0992_01310 [Planctomycetaceae bacterium]
MMFRFARIPFAILATLAALAVAAEPLGAQQKVTGVVRLPDGSPAADVEVHYNNFNFQIEQKDLAVRTDAEGKFTLPLQPQELFGRTITAKNAAGDLLGYKFFMWQRTGNEKPPGLIELKLEPPVSVRAKVVDGSGQPLAGVPVSALADYSFVMTKEADANGLADIPLAAAARLRTVFAKKSGTGFDYVTLIDDQQFYNNNNAAITSPPPTELLELKLDGARTVTVKLEDDKGEPIAGTKIYPWLFTKGGAGQRSPFNSSFATEEFASTTDASGNATFDWFPTWEKSKQFVFWPMIGNRMNEQRIQFDAGSGAESVTHQIERGVSISGLVKKPDGTPASGVNISVRGINADGNQFMNNAQSGADGRYQLELQPKVICILVVDDQEWAAPIKTGISAKSNEDPKSLDFELRTPTKVTGRVTAGAGKVVANQEVTLEQFGMDTNSTPELRRSGNQYIPPLNHYRRTQTDSDGRFEFKVGPGRFMLRGSRNGGPQQFTVKDEPSLEFSFKLERPDRGPLTVQVVPGAEASGAKVGSAVAEVRVQEQWWTPDMGVADGDGKLTFERRLAKGMLLVRTEDQKFATVQELTPDTSSLKIEVQPCGELTGRLVHGVSGKPLKDTDFSYGIQPDLGMTLYAGLGFGGGNGRTDGEGRFKIPNLVVGQKYDFQAYLPDQPLRTQTQLPVPKPESTDVGDVRMIAQNAPVAVTPAAIAVDEEAAAATTKMSWSRMLIIANLIGVPLVAIAFFIWQRRA